MFRLYITGDIGFEFWMDIPGYEGLYQASTYGRVRSLVGKHGGRILKPAESGRRYPKYTLSKNGKHTNFQTHRLIATTFLPNPQNKPAVDHISGNAFDNSVQNLRWVTGKENSLNPVTLGRMLVNRDAKGGKTASVKTYAYNLDGELVGVFNSMQEASRKTGISQSLISLCVAGKRKKTGGMLFTSHPL